MCIIFLTENEYKIQACLTHKLENRLNLIIIIHCFYNAHNHLTRSKSAKIFSPGLSQIIYIDRYSEKQIQSRFSPRLKLVRFQEYGTFGSRFRQLKICLTFDSLTSDLLRLRFPTIGLESVQIIQLTLLQFDACLEHLRWQEMQHNGLTYVGGVNKSVVSYALLICGRWHDSGW